MHVRRSGLLLVDELALGIDFGVVFITVVTLHDKN